jgi:hypothetical protein
MASGVYNIFKTEVMKGTLDLSTDTVRVALLNNSHTFAPSSVTNDTWADISANEISGTGYTANGAALGSPTVTVDNTDNEGVFDGANTSWTTASFTAYHAVLYDDTVSDYLICSIDFGGAQVVSSGTFTIEWATEGIINLT